MNQIWYLCPCPPENSLLRSPESDRLYALADAIAIHLDRCGVSFHIGERFLTPQQQLLLFRDSRASFFLVLGPDCWVGSLEETAMTVAMAIVHADGKPWMPPKGTEHFSFQQRKAPQMYLIRKKEVFS